MVLPVVLEDCAIPCFLRPKRHADFRGDYAVGVAQLAILLHDHTRARAVRGWSNGGMHNENTSEQHHTEQILLSSITVFCYTDDTMKSFRVLDEVQVELNIPYLGRIAGAWKPDEREQNAAWELYVELVTRIAVAELTPRDGLLRESLSSLYSMFTTTRTILRTYGPAVARPKAESQLSFGYLAISMLNYVVRPVLAKWHPLLLDYEHRRDATVSAWEHEQRWEHAEELRHVLNEARSVLLQYTTLLAHISRVPDGCSAVR